MDNSSSKWSSKASWSAPRRPRWEERSRDTKAPADAIIPSLCARLVVRVVRCNAETLKVYLMGDVHTVGRRAGCWSAAPEAATLTSYTTMLPSFTALSEATDVISDLVSVHWVCFPPLSLMLLKRQVLTYEGLCTGVHRGPSGGDTSVWDINTNLLLIPTDDWRGGPLLPTPPFHKRRGGGE